MTVTYTAEVATCRKFGCFIKLLARWRGSIYKLIWMDLLLFLTLYYCINCIYIYLLNENSKRTFESIAYYCGSYTSLIPLSFVLGFYVHLVMSRWWEQYTTIPWPDSIAVFVSAHVHGQDEGGRVMRRTVMRYVCVCLTIVFTMISPCVKKRFPKLKNLVDAGLLLENEKDIIESMDLSFPKYPKHWMPIVWAASIITRARKEGRIRDDFAVKTIIDELNNFRGRCGCLMYFDFISIPLVYTQVVTIAVYSFFVCSLLAHQWTDIKKDSYERLDFYLPVFITLQFFFYMGWLKVAETLINPFGEDDDDFEVNWMIDRNLQVSYLIVDEMHHEHPELVKDQYWDEVYPNELPYEAETKREQPPEPSTAKYDQEDIPRGSVNNSIKNNRKTRFSIQSMLNSRIQRFSEAFQRFSTYSEEDLADVEASIPSTTISENIQHVTSYTSSEGGGSLAESPWDSVNKWSEPRLEPVSEEGEEFYREAVEEEELLMNAEEEEGEKNDLLSSYESDSDSDPFERLRIERLQQRYQRLNDYLERNFGPIFQIVPPPEILPDKFSKNEKNVERVSMEEEQLNEKTLVDSEEQQLLEETLVKLEQKPNLPIKVHYSPLLTIESDLPETKILSDEKLQQKQDLATIELTSALLPSRTTTIEATTQSDFSSTGFEKQSSVLIPQSLSVSEKSSESLDKFHVQIKSPQITSILSTIPIPSSSAVSKLEITSETPLLPDKRPKTSTFHSQIPHSVESVTLTRSIGTSPIGSARSTFSESSISETDDWELLPTHINASTEDYRIDADAQNRKK